MSTASRFASLLNRTSVDSTAKLKQAMTDTKGSYANDNEGFWSIKRDKNTGNGMAVIRFLPAPPEEELPFVFFFRHSFKGPGGWYIENSRTSLGADDADPVTEYNGRLWNTGDDKYKKQASAQSRTKTYVSNILVIKDPADPKNEGKVFKFRFGKKIFEKLEKVMEPEIEGDVFFDPWHVLEGANFRLRVKDQGGFANYDDSSFDAPTALFGGDEDELVKIFEQLSPLQPLVDPSQFKPYDKLKARLDRVMGFDTGAYLTASAALAGSRAAGSPPPAAAASAVPGIAPPVPPASQPALAGIAAKPWTPPADLDDDDDFPPGLDD